MLGVASDYSGVGVAVSHGIATQVHYVITTEAGHGLTSVVSTVHTPRFAVSGLGMAPTLTASSGATLETRDSSVTSQSGHRLPSVLR